MCSAISTDVRFKYPFTCIISGPTGSGKSKFCVRFLQELSSLCTENKFEGGILWCSFSERTSIATKELAALNLNSRYQEGVPVDFKNPGGETCLFILDDMLNDANSSGRVCDLFSKGSHHRNIIVIVITQNIFHQAKNCREISLNAKFLLIFKNVINRSQFSSLTQVYHKQRVVLWDSYQHTI